MRPPPLRASFALLALLAAGCGSPRTGLELNSPDGAPSVDAVVATDAPATDAPATDVPATDAPATDAPATDAPATDAPAADGGSDVPATTCRADTDCGAGLICDRVHGSCVACLTTAGCPAGQLCAAGRCAAGSACTSSRTCPGEVCSSTLAICVECNGDVDCTDGDVCRGSSCVAAPRACASSRNCSDLAQVCDTAHGRCVDCVGDADCDRGQYCGPDTTCHAQVCTPGAMECLSATDARACDAHGSAWVTAHCGSNETCAAGQCRARVCDPGATRCTSGTVRGVCTADGFGYDDAACPAGQTCYAGACQSVVPVDVILLLDVSGSTMSALSTARSALRSNLVTPLLALPQVNVGVAYTCDFPVDPYGTTGDHAFRGAVEPGPDATAVNAAVTSTPTESGGDADDGMIEALGTLSGLSVHPTSVALTCSAGRVAGGCWRPGARHVIVLFTDDSFHNGPLASGAGLEGPYTSVSPAPQSWTTVLPAMRSSQTVLLLLDATNSSSGAPQAQWARMLSDLGQTGSDVFPTATGSTTGTASSAVVARVRALSGM